MTQDFEKSISINSTPAQIWKYLTNPSLMKKWMGEPEMKIEILTDWKVGNPILIKGFHQVAFENKGKVLQFVAYQKIQYSHLSSISRLADTTANYATITWLLTPDNHQTMLTVRIENFPTESIQKHLEFYWSSTLIILKDLIENTAAV